MSEDEMNDKKKTTPQSAEAVRPFVDPNEEWRSMARIGKREAATWAIFLNRHAARPQRNAHRLAIARDLALLTRSEEAFGSNQAASVAQRASAAADSLMDLLVGKPPKKQEDTGEEADE